MQRAVCLWLDRIQHGCTARHGASVPMLQLATSGQNHRKIGRRQIIRRDHLCRCELRPPFRAREGIAKHNALARILWRQRRVCHGCLFQPFPRDVVEAAHVYRHFGKDFTWMCVSPRQPAALGQLNLDPPVFHRFTGRRYGLAQHLHSAIGVRHRPALFIKGGGRKDHISIVRGFSDEDVLHHKVIQLRQRIARMLHIRVRHRWVFAQDIHRLDLVLMNRVHDLRHGQALFIAEITRLPHIGKGRTHTVIGHGLIIRQEHRNEPRIRCTLHVVLAPQRMETRARTPNVPTHQRQRNQAT